MGILGEATYQAGEFSNVRLDAHDLQAYHFDIGSASYIYNGQHYGDEWSVLMTLLE